MVVKIGINGFGRIGRVIFRSCIEHENIEVTAINDPAISIQYMVYLMKFDSTHGKFKGQIKIFNEKIIVNDTVINIYQHKQPSTIPWHETAVQYVIEASGMFTTMEKASGHLESSGVKRVIVTAPSVDVEMIIIGVNEDTICNDVKVLSCASSTLYCLAPIMKVLENNFGVIEGFVTSIHAMTPSLKPLDGLCVRGKHWRDHRGIHQNIIPAATGACKALGKVIPQLKDKLTGIAFRVPIVNVSVLDISLRLSIDTSLQEIIRSIEQAKNTFQRNIINISKDESVSSDFIGDQHSCTVDAESSLQLKPNFYKLICWYENEYSYACRVIDTVFFSEQQLNCINGDVIKTPTLTRQLRVLQEVEYLKGNKCLICSRNNQSRSMRFGDERLEREHGDESDYKVVDKYIPQQIACVNMIQNEKSNTVKQNISSFFRIQAKHKNNTKDLIKTQDRMEKVKREVSKMVAITENLIKKSCKNSNSNNKVSNINIGFSNTKCNESVLHINSNEIVDKSIEDRYKGHSCKIGNLMSSEETISNKSTNYSISFESSKINEPNDLSNTKPQHTSKVCVHDANAHIGNSYQIPQTILTKDGKLNSKTELSTNFTFDKTSSDGIVISNGSNSNVERILSKNTRYATISDSQKNLRETNKLSKESILDQSVGINTMSPKQSYKSTTTMKHFEEGIAECYEIKSDVNKQLYINNEEEMPVNINNIKFSNAAIQCNNQDIYDKLDSVSATDSENSLQIHRRKSQIIDLKDLTNSIEDLSKLEQICKIIEISDELSDKLFSPLNNDFNNANIAKWSLKDLCKRINLDDFCNNVFGNNVM